MKKVPSHPLILWSLLVISAVPVSRGQIYTEIFPNGAASNAGTNANLPFGTSSGWNLFSGPFATDFSNTIGVVAVAPNAGAPADAQPVNSNPANTGIANGIASNFGNGTQTTGFANLYYTNEFSLPTTAARTFSFYMGNNATADVFRVALNINGNWIASQTTFSNTVAVANGAAFVTGAEFRSLNLAGSNFYPLTFTPGTVLSIDTTGTPLPAPTGTITAFGLFSDLKSANQRFDTFQIVPEPSTTLLAVTGFGLFGLMMKRRGRGQGSV